METLIYIGLLLLTYALQPKPKRPKPAGLGDFDLPTADPTRSIQVFWGTIWQTGPTVTDYGDLSSKTIKKGGGFLQPTQYFGRKYFMGLEFCVGYSGGELLAIKWGDRAAWAGSVANGSFYIDAKKLFGGDEDGGGIAGTVRVRDGNANQLPDAYVENSLNGTGSAQRGVMTIVLERFYVGKNTYIEAPAFKLRRTDQTTELQPIWQQALADIDGAMNPIHVVREVLTARWGMRYPASIHDDDRNLIAANQLHDEGFGISTQWSKQQPIGEFLEHICNAFGGIISENPHNGGKLGIDLIRDDYDIDDLVAFDESNSEVLEFTRRAWGETVNEIIVNYIDHNTGKDQTVTVQDSGNIQIQGSKVSETLDYPAIPTADLATRVAARELRAKSSPLSSIRLRTNRQGWAVRRGTAVALTSTKHGLDKVAYRVLEVDGGDLLDGAITLELVEDVFGLQESTYVRPFVYAWQNPLQPPQPALAERVYTATYWELVRRFGTSEAVALTANYGIAIAVAVRAQESDYYYALYGRHSGASEYASLSSGEFCASATLVDALPVSDQLTDVTLALAAPVDLDLAPLGLAYLGTELVAVVGIDVDVPSVTVDRAVVDTVPKSHPAGERIWFVQDDQAVDSAQAIGQAREYKVLPISGQGALDIAAASALPITISNRARKPYPPGNIKLNGSAYPPSISGELTVSWSHRDRTQQALLIPQTDSDIGPEAGTTYTVRLYDETDVLRRTASGLAGTSYTWTTEAEDSGLVTPIVTHTLTNPDAETGDTSSWTVELGNFSVRTANPTAQQGTYYFYGGPSNADSQMASEFIDLLADGVLAADIDAGNLEILVTYIQSSFSGNDRGQVGVRFYDATDTLISDSANTLQSVSPAQTWVERSDGHAIPVGTRSIQVFLRSVRYAGDNNDGYFDDIRLETRVLGGRLNTSLRIELEAVRDGIASWQAHNITVARP